MQAAGTTDYTKKYTVCPGCDLLLHEVQPTPGHTVVCPRCQRRLHREQPNSVQRALALAASGMLLFLPANFLPLMNLHVLGIDTGSSLFTASLSMFSQGQPFVGFIVLLTGFVFPLLTLSLLFWVSAGLFLGWKARWMPDFMRWYRHLSEWAMTDIYLIGVFVTIIKMNHTADIQFNAGFFCFLGLVILTVAAQTSVDKPLFWELLEGKEKGHPLQEHRVSIKARTGKEAGLVLCHTCHKTLPASLLASDESLIRCPRCGELLHQRKQGSISRTWAFICSAIILSFPANMLPIMDVDYFGQTTANTIMDGIIFFFQEGSYGIGLIILTASILVPLFKIVGMMLILLSIKFNWSGWLKHKSIMFRFIEFIGRWSMLDIFVIALLCALVQFGYFSTITAAPAALYFTCVVLCTMSAAISFDLRVLWDTESPPSPRDAAAEAVTPVSNTLLPENQY